LLVSSALLVLAGCSSPNKESGFNTETGRHADNWYGDHRVAFLKNSAACAECHGADLKGGISRVSCFSASFSGLTCHANGPSNHPDGWADPAAHGATAKSAPSSTSGFSLCQACHGNDFIGGFAQKSCLNTAGCHGLNVNAPHSPKPWRSGIRTHTNTDANNAPVCAGCHTNGANSSVQPSPPAPAGITPGCFNNTLCHATVGHPAGWAVPTEHGSTAKSAPTTTSGFSYCQTCHGNDFSGGAALQTCLNTAGCHGAAVNAPHSPKPWRGGTYTHTTTDQGNAPVCAMCHTNGANSSVQPSAPAPAGTAAGCFNNTLCHAVVGHPAGWAVPTAHGSAAKAAPSATTGFSLCQTCHGNDFSGGAALQTCLSTAGCHGAAVNAPHAFPWIPGSTSVHTSTNQGNAPVCALCHLGNRTPPSYAAVPAGTNPGCFNNTLCHAQTGAPHAVPYTDPALHGPPAKADLTYCESCHAAPADGAAGSNPRFNVPKGSLTTGCEGASCHAANTAHPSLASSPASPWRGFTPKDTGHMNAGNMANACVLCHGVNLGGGAGPACTSCHKLGSPLALSNCTSCHGNPPNGSVYPNAAGKHAQHGALGSYIDCAACHTGGGTGTANHDNGNTSAFVAFISAYSAKTGTASYNASANTCSNVSCHGGQTTPGWLSGATITINTQCGSCHASGTTQFNGYYSGHHSTHLGSDVNAICTDCHDAAKLAAVHFNDLNTPVMSEAWKTIITGAGYTGTGNGTFGNCTLTCHGETHRNRAW
jgi:predicted CxxxxCH...CXXCH cytochrome family protein